MLKMHHTAPLTATALMAGLAWVQTGTEQAGSHAALVDIPDIGEPRCWGIS
jgi:hypothetical protein